MRVGDLVRVSNKGFTAIGYIKETLHSHYVVYYFSISDEDMTLSEKYKCGLWTKQYITLLKEVKHEKETGKT